MNDKKINPKGITRLEDLILILTILFAFIPIGISNVEVLGPGNFDFYVTTYNGIIIKYDGGFSDEELNKYIDMPVPLLPVIPKFYRSLMIGFIIGFISFLCMKGKHYLFSIWFFVIFIISLGFSCLIFFHDYNYYLQTGQIMFLPPKLLLLIYAFCNLYVGYKKVRGRRRVGSV